MLLVCRCCARHGGEALTLSKGIFLTVFLVPESQDSAMSLRFKCCLGTAPEEGTSLTELDQSILQSGYGLARMEPEAEVTFATVCACIARCWDSVPQVANGHHKRKYLCKSVQRWILKCTLDQKAGTELGLDASGHDQSAGRTYRCSKISEVAQKA